MRGFCGGGKEEGEGKRRGGKEEKMRGGVGKRRGGDGRRGEDTTERR